MSELTIKLSFLCVILLIDVMLPAVTLHKAQSFRICDSGAEVGLGYFSPTLL